MQFARRVLKTIMCQKNLYAFPVRLDIEIKLGIILSMATVRAVNVRLIILWPSQAHVRHVLAILHDLAVMKTPQE